MSYPRHRRAGWNVLIISEQGATGGMVSLGTQRYTTQREVVFALPLACWHGARRCLFVLRWTSNDCMLMYN